MESNRDSDPLNRFGNREESNYRSNQNERSEGSRPYRNDRQDGDRPYRSEGSRPYNNDRQDGDRPYRSEGSRPYRNDRQDGDRPYRSEGSRPYNNNRQDGDRPYRSEGGRPYNNDRQDGDRPYRSEGSRPYNNNRQDGDRPYRSEGGRPYRNDRQDGDRPYRSEGGDGSYRRSYNNGGGYGGNRPRFSKPLKPKGRSKTETQMFIVYKDEEIPTLFPVPVNASFPYFQRAIGMAEGTIVEANEKGNGTVNIEGSDYPLKENRDPSIMKRYPMSKYIGKTIKFTFYPTITSKGIKMLKLEPDSAPFIKVANFRKELSKQGVVEAIGTIKSIEEKYFVVGIWSASSKKEYVVTIFGTGEFKLGDFVKVDGVLDKGVIKAENIRVFDIPQRRSY